VDGMGHFQIKFKLFFSDDLAISANPEISISSKIIQPTDNRLAFFNILINRLGEKIID
jgi:hypothetical protein